ncbi:hypothetical protein V496_06484 [Pseudogymnoascus sp. VKM F-4515 (FW-2607)]|nr:hypothetical protein V496_06484 [Pseudogymnoascus sp. VKM F-4515 (FW-2607)]
MSKTTRESKAEMPSANPQRQRRRRQHKKGLPPAMNHQHQLKERHLPTTNHRHQHKNQHLPTEWEEFRRFSYPVKAIYLDAANKIQAKDIHWGTAMKEPNLRLAVYIPEGLVLPWPHIKEKVQDVATSAILKLITTPHPLQKKTPGRRLIHLKIPKDVRHQDPSYIAGERQKYGLDLGVLHLGYWHAQGHANEEAVLSKDTISSGAQLNAVNAFYQAIRPLIQTIGRLFQGVDREAYEQYRLKFDTQCLGTMLQQYRVSNRCCFNNIALLVNARVHPHKDSGDVKHGWVAMACFGDFTGGELCLPGLGHKIPF